MPAEEDSTTADEESVEEEDEPCLWTLLRATVIGFAFTICILSFATTLVLVEEKREIDEAISKTRTRLILELELLMENSSVPFEKEKGSVYVADVLNVFTNMCRKGTLTSSLTSVWSMKTGVLLATSILTTTGTCVCAQCAKVSAP